MSFSFPVLDMVKDAFRSFSNESILIITDGNLPVRIFPNDGARPVEFHVYTTALSECRKFGVHAQRQPGYMTHGFTPTAVKKPFVGQDIFFWSTGRCDVSYSQHKVRRIYYGPVQKLIPDPMKHLRDLLTDLDRSLNSLDWNRMFITYSIANSYDDFLRTLMFGAVKTIVDKSMTLTADQTAAIFSLANDHFQIDIDPLFHSGLISLDGDRLVISDALYLLTMDAIHRAKPVSTFFDEQGVLQAF